MDNTIPPSRLFESVISYIDIYIDTSFKKDNRLESANNAAKICEHIAIMYPNKTDTDKLIHDSFLKLSIKLKQASIDRNTLYEFDNEIGFLRIINSIVSS